MTAPTSMPKPPLEDPLNERELFASEFDEPIGANPAKAHRIVAGRIVLTGVAASQLLEHLKQLAAQIEAIAAAAAGHKPH
jgi:hypothetical protein